LVTYAFLLEDSSQMMVDTAHCQGATSCSIHIYTSMPEVTLRFFNMNFGHPDILEVDPVTHRVEACSMAATRCRSTGAGVP
jgi:hypothetical protein